MLVEHTLSVMARCPVNGAVDVYEVTFKLTRLLKVEDLLAAVEEYRKRTIFQEELTQELADYFKCEVVSVGTHSTVRTKVYCTDASASKHNSEPVQNPA